MTPNGEQLERLVVRKIHGELTDDESLELDRAMIRDPQVRELLDEYGGIDSLASTALEAAFAGDDRVAHGFSRGGRQRNLFKRRVLTSRWLAPVAIAASIALAMVIPIGHDSGSTRTVERSPQTGGPVETVEPGDGLSVPDSAPLRRVGTRPRATRRSVARDVLGVMGEDGKTIYFIEVDRTRTMQYPGDNSKDRRVRDGL